MILLVVRDAGRVWVSDDEGVEEGGADSAFPRFALSSEVGKAAASPEAPEVELVVPPVVDATAADGRKNNGDSGRGVSCCGVVVLLLVVSGDALSSSPPG